MRWLVVAAAGGLGIGCGAPPPVPRTISSPSPTAEASAEQILPLIDRQPGCVTVPRFEDGRERAAICVTTAAAHGLTVVDLTDTWTPTLFAPTPDADPPQYRARYLALAAERDARGRQLEGEDALDELYGVVPALSIVRARLGDETRHACRAEIDPAPIGHLSRAYWQDDRERVKTADAVRAALARQLEHERARRALVDVSVLATERAWKARYARWQALEEQHAGLVTAEQVLHCEGYLAAKDTDGSMSWRTGLAIELFQRRNFLMPTGKLDPETREALALDSRELDLRLALRVLRERVAEAAGLIEDGTAGEGPQPVLGRMLDPADMRAARGHPRPLPEAAPDLVDAATDAAARQLGWTDPDAVRAFLDAHPEGVRIALALPPVPTYHAAHMELSAEIDRGDVYYDARPLPFRRIVAHRPTFVLYVDDGGVKRPLVRWPTTIGGWADQRMSNGMLVQRWKESDVGPRVWRDLFAAPTWIPPKSTPDGDLVKNLWNGHWGLKSEVLGPGPHAAFGMMLLPHLLPVDLPDGTQRFDSNGIGTHGSASVTSIVRGTSHGCHRLYNQLAVRLGDFLLQHRTHVVRGEQPVAWARIVRHGHEAFAARLSTRGFLYELTPPVPVNVLKGKILSRRKVPPRLIAPARP